MARNSAALSLWLVAGGLVAKADGCPLRLQAARRGHQPPAQPPAPHRARGGSWSLLAATGLSGQPAAFATSHEPG